MDTKNEGPAFLPIPAYPRTPRESGAHVARILREEVEPRCEMCGNEVLATHCKRICLRCGFMTGCSDGM